jgi:hypothetical protein
MQYAKPKHYGRVAILSLSALLVAGTAEKISGARDAAEKALAYAEKANVARDIAFRAAENAIADCNDTEVALLKSLKEHGTTSEIQAHRKRVKSAVEASLDAITDAADVAAYSSESSAAAGKSKQEAIRARDTVSERDASSAARKAISSSKRAKYHCKKAVALADRLKARWLIPHGLGATGETARVTSQP